MLVLNVIVLIMEVLYYSLFMKFAKGEGKLWRYLLSFGLITTLFMFIGTQQIYKYLLLVLLMLLALKYISKLNIKLYDMLIIILMLFTKIIIEAVCVFAFYNILKLSIIFVTIIFTVVKFIFVFINKNKFHIIYKKLLLKWNNNNFYIRYIFSVFMIIYAIISIAVLI